MRFIEKGDLNCPTLMFIHGLSATAESCYGKVSDVLKEQWHIILCEIDGHYPGSVPFSTIDSTCKEIEAYVIDHYDGKIYGMIGLSLGGAIAVSLLARRKIEVTRTILDAAYCMDMGRLKKIYG